MALRGRRDPRKVVGWQLASNMRTTLVLDASKMALGQRRPGDLAAGPLTGLDAAIDRAVSLDELDRVAREVPLIACDAARNQRHEYKQRHKGQRGRWHNPNRSERDV
jgi:hypothetical protein